MIVGGGAGGVAECEQEKEKQKKTGTSHHHSHDLLASFADAELELLDHVRDFFEAVHVGVMLIGHVRDYQERRSLEKHHLVSPAARKTKSKREENKEWKERGK